MRVAVLTAFPQDPGAPAGGVEAVSVNLVRALARRSDLDIHVVTTDPTCAARNVSTWNGATLHRLPANRGSMLRFFTGPGRRTVQSYLADLAPDVVHAHDTFGLMVKGLRRPRVLTIHGFIHEDTLRSGGRCAWLRSRLWRRIELAVWADQPHIIAISPFVRDRLQGIARGEIHDIENPVAEEFFQIERTEDAAQGVILCAAAIRRLKNTLGLVEAFAQVARLLPKSRLRLAGPVIEPDYLGEIQAFIAKNHLADKVTLLGSISAEDVRKELARASVFALLSLQENSPMCIAEAMAAGLPVVTSNRCGMPYMISDGQTGFLVDPLDGGATAARLKQLLTDDALRTRMGERAKQEARARYHPETVAAKTRHVYAQSGRHVPASARSLARLNHLIPGHSQDPQ